MRRSSYVFSASLHAAAVAVAIWGLPFFQFEPEPEPPIILAELAPIAEQSNIPKVQQEVKAPPKPETPPEPPKPEAKPEPPKPVTAAPPPPPPPPPPEPPKPVEKPTPKPEAKPEEIAPAPPKPVSKPEPPKPEPPKPPQQTQAKAPDFSSVAALVNKLQKNTPQPQQAPQPQVAAKSAPPAPQQRMEGPANPNLPLSISERDFIASQIYDKWNLDCGRRDAREHIVRIQVQLNADGTLKSQPELLDTVRVMSQESYRAAAEAARRAVFKAAPFRFPPGADVQKFTQEMVLNFDPRQQCNS